MDLLRKRCPCATCNAVRTAPKNDSLRVLSAQEILPENIQIREAEMVGRYALQFNWSDGHHEGIYSFDYLRQLCQCDDCKHVIKD
ncbi:MAG: gamma-butyrobetaine hydroxylase-like domain-containing protein [bacterium]